MSINIAKNDFDSPSSWVKRTAYFRTHFGAAATANLLRECAALSR